MLTAETRNCRVCSVPFALDADDLAFYAKMDVPPPALCPDCRFRRRSAFRNEHNLYKGTCARCGRSVITMYTPANADHVVYCNDCWHSDLWDPLSYGRAYDPKRRFLDQLKDLLRACPKPATYLGTDHGPNVNSEYSNFAGSLKNCYLVFNSSPKVEDSAYSRGLANAQDVYDSYFANGVERLYECVNAQRCARVRWGQNVSDCVDSWFLLNCAGCQNCFGCVNMRHKSYCFFNEQLSKEEWQAKTQEILGSYAAMEAARQRFEDLALRYPRRENSNWKAEKCAGDYISESKACRDCFEVDFGEDLRYCFATKYAKDSYDLTGHGRQGELLLDNVAVGTSSRVLGSWWVETSHDIEYCFMVRGSEHCLGCAGVKGGRYMILNRAYSETEYRFLRARIVAELKEEGVYGMFPPPELTVFAYNESIGQDYMPLTKTEALAQGFRWTEDFQVTIGKETLRPGDLPDRIEDAPDSILQEILACVECGRNYRLIRPELDHYRSLKIPLPRRCFNCRLMDRLRRKGPMRLFDRTCGKCSKAIRTIYAPDRPEIVYCETCYQAEVI